MSGLEAPVPVTADHVRLSQVLGNLLSNAAKYTPIGGTIDLAVTIVAEKSDSARKNVVVIEVRDNGIGIDSSMQPHVFKATLKKVNGIGRSIVRCA
ncbi:sensor histidine kinase [Paraburkholderia sp. RL17-337-BIB-A]|uniref:sensor histidine kinase n=1 Tax=Paraburkholderia sp. RL17-337-BIB-A TaxID=3031636 RepID=UPI0038B8F015